MFTDSILKESAHSKCVDYECAYDEIVENAYDELIAEINKRILNSIFENYKNVKKIRRYLLSNKLDSKFKYKHKRSYVFR